VPAHRFLVLFGALALSASACAGEAGGRATADPTVPTAPLAPVPIDGPLADSFDLDGADLWVGSEDTSTQRLLGYIALEALDSVGAEVEDRVGMGGSLLARESLLSGEIDLYWERMGTAWSGYLREPDLPDDLDDLYRQLAARDAAENGVIWLAPADFSDGSGFAMADRFASALDISTVGDMASYIDDGGPTNICVTSDFTTFPVEGRLDYEEKTDSQLADETLRVWDPEPIYPSTGDGTCLFGQVQRVNGRVVEYDLRVLADDVGLFGFDNPAMTVRQDVYDEYPQLAPLFALLAGALDESTMQGLNEQVEVGGENPREVARSWLEAEGFVD
jgi:osmoprotectant transport system substrate-binding protein